MTKTKAFFFIKLFSISITLFAQNNDITSNQYVTAGSYCAFLNAVGATDADHLYDEKMQTDLESRAILRSGAPGHYGYELVGGDKNIPIRYVNWLSKVEYCHWLQNNTSYFPVEQREDPLLISNYSEFHIAIGEENVLLQGDTSDIDKYNNKYISEHSIIFGTLAGIALLIVGPYYYYYPETTRDTAYAAVKSFKGNFKGNCCGIECNPVHDADDNDHDADGSNYGICEIFHRGMQSEALRYANEAREHPDMLTLRNAVKGARAGTLNKSTGHLNSTDHFKGWSQKAKETSARWEKIFKKYEVVLSKIRYPISFDDIQKEKEATDIELKKAKYKCHYFKAQEKEAEMYLALAKFNEDKSKGYFLNYFCRQTPEAFHQELASKTADAHAAYSGALLEANQAYESFDDDLFDDRLILQLNLHEVSTWLNHGLILVDATHAEHVHIKNYLSYKEELIRGEFFLRKIDTATTPITGTPLPAVPKKQPYCKDAYNSYLAAKQKLKPIPAASFKKFRNDAQTKTQEIEEIDTQLAAIEKKAKELNVVLHTPTGIRRPKKSMPLKIETQDLGELSDQAEAPRKISRSLENGDHGNIVHSLRHCSDDSLIPQTSFQRNAERLAPPKSAIIAATAVNTLTAGGSDKARGRSGSFLAATAAAASEVTAILVEHKDEELFSSPQKIRSLLQTARTSLATAQRTKEEAKAAENEAEKKEMPALWEEAIRKRSEEVIACGHTLVACTAYVAGAQGKSLGSIEQADHKQIVESLEKQRAQKEAAAFSVKWNESRKIRSEARNSQTSACRATNKSAAVLLWDETIQREYAERDLLKEQLKFCDERLGLKPFPTFDLRKFYDSERDGISHYQSDLEATITWCRYHLARVQENMTPEILENATKKATAAEDISRQDAEKILNRNQGDSSSSGNNPYSKSFQIQKNRNSSWKARLLIYQAAQAEMEAITPVEENHHDVSLSQRMKNVVPLWDAAERSFSNGLQQAESFTEIAQLPERWEVGLEYITQEKMLWRSKISLQEVMEATQLLHTSESAAAAASSVTLLEPIATLTPVIEAMKTNLEQSAYRFKEQQEQCLELVKEELLNFPQLFSQFFGKGDRGGSLTPKDY